MNSNLLNINLAGCSGIGKTTLAKAISEKYQIPFVSGSYSDLIPSTKEIPHSDMIQKEAKEIFLQDVQLLNARKNLFAQHEQMVSDRSYLDSAAYMIQKLSHRLPQCEIEDFLEKCRVLTSIQTPLIIYLPFTIDYFHNWNMEDNGKRVLNKFYQAEISAIMDWLIKEYWGFQLVFRFRGGNEIYNKNNTTILRLVELDHKERMDIIRRFIAIR